jgi:predicted nucleotidyltransferase
MKNSTILTDIGILSKVFQGYLDILAVYLFSSFAIGHMHRESDIDLAIVPRNSSIQTKRLDILTDLARSGFCHVDVLFLDTNDIILKYEAVRQNKLVYRTEDFDRGALYSKILRQYFDFSPYLKIQREAYKRRILRDQT